MKALIFTSLLQIVSYPYLEDSARREKSEQLYKKEKITDFEKEPPALSGAEGGVHRCRLEENCLTALYNFKPGDTALIQLNSSLQSDGLTRRFEMNCFSSDEKVRLSLRVLDHNDKTHEIQLGLLQYRGWRTLKAAFDMKQLKLPQNAEKKPFLKPVELILRYYGRDETLFFISLTDLKVLRRPAFKLSPADSFRAAPFSEIIKQKKNDLKQ